MTTREVAARSQRRPAAGIDAENIGSAASMPAASGRKLTSPPPYVGLYAQRLMAAGYLLTPTKAHPPEERKEAYLPRWTRNPLRESQIGNHAVSGVGVLCGQGAHPLAAFDIDSTNADLAEHMVRWCSEHLGQTIERVGKPPKILLVYRAAEPDWRKVTGVWFIDQAGERHRSEVLGCGQQFVAFAHHPDTNRPYEWVDPLGGILHMRANELPIVTRGQVDAFVREFEAAAERFGLEREATRPTSSGLPAKIDHVGGDDSAADTFVDGLDEVDQQPLGLTPAEISAHAHNVVAAGEWDSYDIWLHDGQGIHHETGGSEEGFEVWHEASTSAAKYDGRDACRKKWHSFKITRPCGGKVRTIRRMVKASNRLARADLILDAKGKPLPRIENMIRVVQDPRRVGLSFEYDSFLNLIMVHAPGETVRRPIRDEDYVDVMIAFEKCGLPRGGMDICRAVVSRVAHTCETDCLIQWAESLDHDGVPRVANLLTCYFGASDDEYSAAVSNYLMSAVAGRAVDPGHKADMAVALIGRQGLGKSTGAAALAPMLEFFGEVTFDRKEDDIARELQGKVIVELSELAGLSSRDVEHVKSFLSRTIDEWIPKFKEHPVRRPRRCVFLATTNEPRFLADSSGHRRWLPVEVGEVDVEALARDRDQLWAEGLQLFRRHGVMWQDAERLARKVHQRHVVEDAWEPLIAQWLAGSDDLSPNQPAPRNTVRVADVLEQALNLARGQMTSAAGRRVAGILRGLGWREDRKRVDGVRERVWVPA